MDQGFNYILRLYDQTIKKIDEFRKIYKVANVKYNWRIVKKYNTYIARIKEVTKNHNDIKRRIEKTIKTIKKSWQGSDA